MYLNNSGKPVKKKKKHELFNKIFIVVELSRLSIVIKLIR